MLPTTRDNVCSAWAAYTVRTKQRDAVKQYLNNHGIASAIYYGVPFHKRTACQRIPVIDGYCPVAERACGDVLSLPMGPYIDVTTQSRIAKPLLDALVQVISEYIARKGADVIFYILKLSLERSTRIYISYDLNL